jgi:hypothetical protein
MMRETKESTVPTLKGTGTLNLPSGAISVKYSIEPDPRHQMEGRNRGWALHLKGELFAADHLGTDLVLTLEDGQQWDCLLVNKAGDLASRGPRGIYRP